MERKFIIFLLSAGLILAGCNETISDEKHSFELNNSTSLKTTSSNQEECSKELPKASDKKDTVQKNNSSSEKLDNCSIKDFESYKGIAFGNKSRENRDSTQAKKLLDLKKESNNGDDSSPVLLGQKKDGSFESIEFVGSSGKEIDQPDVTSFKRIESYSGYRFRLNEKFKSNFAVFSVRNTSLSGNVDFRPYLLDLRTGLIYSYSSEILLAGGNYLYGNDQRLSIQDGKLVEEKFENIAKLGTPYYADQYGNCIYVSDSKYYLLPAKKKEITILFDFAVGFDGTLYVRKERPKDSKKIKSSYKIVDENGELLDCSNLPSGLIFNVRSSLGILYQCDNKEIYYARRHLGISEDEGYFSYNSPCLVEVDFNSDNSYSASVLVPQEGLYGSHYSDDLVNVMIECSEKDGKCVSGGIVGSKVYFLYQDTVMTYDFLTFQYETVTSFGEGIIVQSFYMDAFGGVFFEGRNSMLEEIKGEILPDGSISYDVSESEYSISYYYPINGNKE